VSGSFGSGEGDEVAEGREQLVTLVRSQAAASECWQRAEAVMRGDELRRRLVEVGVASTPDVATSLMAAAMLLATESDEFGGDYRDALADLAALGLELFEG
jgi:hypothetical protein